MNAGSACLVVADESPEFPAALTYAALLAKRAGLRLIMLRVIEPVEPAPWASVSEEMRRQAQAGAESLTQRFAAEAWALCGVTAEPVIIEGELRPEIKKLIDAQPAITLVVLGAAHGPGGPGPLVSSMAKGHHFGGRAVPVLVVPGSLTQDEIQDLVLPVAPAGDAPPA